MIKAKASAVYVFAGLWLSLLCLSFLADRKLPLYLLMASIAVGSIYTLAREWRDSFLLAIFATIPLSLNLATGIGDSKMFLPSELLVAVCGGVTVFLIIRRPADYFVPWPWLAGFVLFIGSAALSIKYSSQSIVSLKFVLVKVLYFLVFFLLPYMLIRKDSRNFFRLTAVFLITLLPLTLVILYKHGSLEFSKDFSGTVTKPFFNDHTIYSAVLALILPASFAAFNSREKSFRWSVLFPSLLVIPAAIFFSYCRASWVSVVCMVLVGVYMSLKFSPRWIFIFLATLLSYVTLNSDELLLKLRQNHSDSNARNANVEQQARSITNISNDESNAERLNRWSCAARMFHEKPYTGFGAGTYQFEYLPYQRYKEMTRISITNPWNIQEGRGGSAHSEYLLALSETGLFGMLGLVFLFLFSIFSGVRLNRIMMDKTDKAVLFAATLAITGYAVHAFFNNFLDTDKVSSLLFASMAAVAALYRKNESEQV